MLDWARKSFSLLGAPKEKFDQLLQVESPDSR